MHRSHAPVDYRYPFCAIVAGEEDARTVVFRDDLCFAVVALHQKPRNHGALLLCTIEHFENVYVVPDAVGAHLFGVAKRLALALKRALSWELSCDGVMLRQNNEPASGQDVWHYHQHIVPRWEGDDFLTAPRAVMPLEERVGLAERIKQALASETRYLTDPR